MLENTDMLLHLLPTGDGRACATAERRTGKKGSNPTGLVDGEIGARTDAMLTSARLYGRKVYSEAVDGTSVAKALLGRIPGTPPWL